jgi:hypothetical protein
METSVIVGLARDLITLLDRRDPLVDRVHFSKPRSVLIAGRAAVSALAARVAGRRGIYQAVRDDAA